MGELTLWNIATQNPRGRFKGRPFAQVTAMGYSPDGRWLAVGDTDAGITFWDPESGEMVERDISEGRDLVCHVAYLDLDESIYQIEENHKYNIDYICI